MHGLSNRVPIMKSNLASALTECPICQQPAEPLVWHLSPGVSFSYLVVYIRTFPPWKEQSYILTGIDTYSEYRFSFPTCNISTTAAIHWLVDAFLTIIIFYTAYLLVKELILQQTKYRNGPMLMVLPCPPLPPKVLAWQNSGMAFKTQIQWQLGSKTLQGWDDVPQEAVCALDQQPICGGASPIDRTHGTVIGVEMAETSLTSHPLETFLHLVPTSEGSGTGHTFRRRNASTMGHSNGSLKVEVETATWPFWDPQTRESTGKKRELFYWLGWLSLTIGGNWFATTPWSKGGICLECKKFPGAP